MSRLEALTKRWRGHRDSTLAQEPLPAVSMGFEIVNDSNYHAASARMAELEGLAKGAENQGGVEQAAYYRLEAERIYRAITAYESRTYWQG